MKKSIFCFFIGASVSSIPAYAIEPYIVDEILPPGYNVVFNWTTDNNTLPEPFRVALCYADEPIANCIFQDFPGPTFSYTNNTFYNRRLRFERPSANATDYIQTNFSPGGRKTTTGVVNILTSVKQDQPLPPPGSFATLSAKFYNLPTIFSDDKDTFLYVLMNESIYSALNPSGINGGNWQLEDTLGSLSVKIKDGQLQTIDNPPKVIQGVWYSTTPWILNPGNSYTTAGPLYTSQPSDKISALHSVPAPMPALALGVGFGFSRKLRNRIKSSS